MKRDMTHTQIRWASKKISRVVCHIYFLYNSVTFAYMCSTQDGIPGDLSSDPPGFVFWLYDSRMAQMAQKKHYILAGGTHKNKKHIQTKVLEMTKYRALIRGWTFWRQWLCAVSAEGDRSFCWQTSVQLHGIGSIYCTFNEEHVVLEITFLGFRLLSSKRHLLALSHNQQT